MTWPPRDIVPNPNADVTSSEEVTVIFPAASFPVGHEDPQPRRGQRHAGRRARPRSSAGPSGPARSAAAGTVTAGSQEGHAAGARPGPVRHLHHHGREPERHAARRLPRAGDPAAAAGDGAGRAPNLTGTGTGAGLDHGDRRAATCRSAARGGGWTATAPAGTGIAAVRLRHGARRASSPRSRCSAGIPANGIDRNGQPIVAGSTIQNCIDDHGAPGRPSTGGQCTTQTIVPVSVDFSKVLTSSPVTAPGQTVSWEIGVGVPPTSAGDLVNPRITDCLPPGLDLLDPINPANPINGTATGFSVRRSSPALRAGAAPTRT